MLACIATGLSASCPGAAKLLSGAFQADSGPRARAEETRCGGDEPAIDTHSEPTRETIASRLRDRNSLDKLHDGPDQDPDAVELARNVARYLFVKLY